MVVSASGWLLPGLRFERYNFNVLGATMTDDKSTAFPLSKSIKGTFWFLFLLAVWMAAVVWPYWRKYGIGGPPRFDLEYALTLWFAPLIGAVVILILMLADVISRRSAFPRNIVTFVVVAVGINIVTLILSYLGGELFWGLRPPLVVSVIMIARNIMRWLMAWAHTA